MKKLAQNPTSTHWARTDEPLFWLSGAGHEIVYPADGYWCDCRIRNDPHLAFQMTLSGAGFYERDGKRMLLKPGMAFFDIMPGDFRYGFPAGAEQEYELVWVDMAGPAAESMWRHIMSAFGNVLSFGPDDPIAPMMLAIARQHAGSAHFDRYVLSAQLYDLLMTVISTLNNTRVATTPLVLRAMELIRKKGLQPNCSVEGIADEAGCSREHLTREFKAAMGVGPADCLMQHRLRQAAHLLRKNGDKLEIVAARCGFSGANYFCRVFRQQMGVTPNQYRARSWQIRIDGMPATAKS